MLAVGEAAALLAPEPDGDGTLAVAFDVDADGLRVDLRLRDRPGPGWASARPGVAAAVLDASVDEWRVSDGGRRVGLDKRLTDTDTDDD